MKKIATLALALCLAPLLAVPALAQSSPGLITGQVPTAAQWNSYFAAKQDVLGYIPLNTAGGVMQGRLTTAASTSTQAGLNLPPGTPPGQPHDGDLWITSSGLFARINGSTVGPFVSSATSGITVGTSAVDGGTSGNILTDASGVLGQIAPTVTINGNVCQVGGANCPITATATSITVGSTGILSGTSGRALVNTSGTLGDVAISGTGNLAAVNSPTFVTPSLGAATGTSLSLSGTVLSITGTGGQIELGSTLSSGASFVDFHSSGNANDYDSRIVSTGGGASIGHGTVQILAQSTVIGGSAQVVAGLQVGSSGVAISGASNGAATLVVPSTAGGSFLFPQVSGTKTVALLDQTSQTITGGANVTPLSLTASASVTVDCGARPLQYVTGYQSAWQIVAPSNDGSCMLLLTNPASAVNVPTFSGFSVGAAAGSALTTTASQRFSISIWRINGVAGYAVNPNQ